LQAVEQFDNLDFSGGGSSLGKALHDIAERYRGQPLAGVLVFSDGNATDISGSFDGNGLPPVFSALVGGDGSARDISLRKVAVTQTAFEDAPVTMQADVAASGCNGEEIVAQLLDAKGAIVESQTQKADSSDKVLGF